VSFVFNNEEKKMVVAKRGTGREEISFVRGSPEKTKEAQVALSKRGRRSDEKACEKRSARASRVSQRVSLQGTRKKLEYG